MNSLYTEINKVIINNLNESLLSKLVNWFKNLYKTQETLKDNNKSLKINIKNIKGPDKPVNLKDIESNKEELKLINDPEVGFPLTSILLKNKNKYLVKEDTNGNKQQYNILVDRYFYIDGNNKYDIGIILFDDQINDNYYVNVINIEIIKQIDNDQEVLKFINNIFENKMKTKSGFKGSQYTVNHPQIKRNIQLLGYKQKDNKDILYKEFK